MTPWPGNISKGLADTDSRGASEDDQSQSQGGG